MKNMKTAFASTFLILLAFACGVPQEQFDVVAAELQGTKADLDSAQAQIAGLQDEATVTASVLSTMERDISDLQAKLNEGDALLSEANAGLDAAAEELAQSERTIASQSAFLDSRNDDVVALRKEVSELEEAVANDKSAIADLGQTIAERDAELQANQRQAESLEIDVTLLETSAADLVKQVVDMQAQVTALQAQVDKNSEGAIQAAIDELIDERDALVAKVKQLATITEGYLSDPDVEIDSSGLACTGSMLPLLHCGDIVIMQTNLKNRDIHEGDIISFQRRDCFTGRTVTNAVILHRVVDIDGGWFVTQGDNNYTVDSCRLPLINVTGKLLAYIEDIYPEHYVETTNYEAIKSRYNDLQERFDRDLLRYQEQVELLEDSEDEYKDGEISFSNYLDIYDDTEDDRLSLSKLFDELDDLADTFFALQDLIVQRTYRDADWAQLVN